MRPDRSFTPKPIRGPASFRRQVTMTRAVAILWMLLASAAGLATEKRASPDDVSALVHRVEICAHLAGEFGSDDPDRERELTRSWEESRCDDAFLGKDIKSARKKYFHNPGALAPLDDALRRVRDELGIEF
jgi:hypothetical protein